MEANKRKQEIEGERAKVGRKEDNKHTHKQTSLAVARPLSRARAKQTSAIDERARTNARERENDDKFCAGGERKESSLKRIEIRTEKYTHTGRDRQQQTHTCSKTKQNKRRKNE